MMLFRFVMRKCNTSLSQYFICHSNISETNYIKKIKEKCEEENALLFGLSPLYCRIKLIECIFHIVHCINIKKFLLNLMTKIK